MRTRANCSSVGLVLLVGFVLLSPPGTAGATSAAPQIPTASPTQLAEAIASPSVVNVGVHWKGYVDFPSSLDLPGGVTYTHDGWIGPFEVDTSCSGFIANSNGYVVTAGHCIDDQSMTSGGKADVIDAFISEYKSKWSYTSEEVAALRQVIENTGKVEGTESGSPPERTVTVYTTGMSGGSSGQVANAVDFKTQADGDVALLKVETSSELPVVAVATTTPPTGTPIVLAGFAGSVSGVVDANQRPSFKDGETSSQQTVNGVPFTEVSAAATAGMSGGPAVDTQGQVVGTISFKPGGETQQFNFITATSTVRSLLARNGVSNRLGAPDTAYRQGLTAFYGRHYHDAVNGFNQVLAVEPNNVSAQQYKQLSIENYPNEISSGNAALYIGIAAGAAVIIGIGVVLFLLWRRRNAASKTPAVSGDGHVGAEVHPPVAPPAATMSAIPLNGVGGAPPQWSESDGDGAAGDGAGAEAPGVRALAEASDADEVYCPSCGHPHDQDTRFCVKCGTNLERHEAGHGASGA
ncbi:MAG TPA: trypsin-like peptidase domain-containing protein [Acidimicrobiales bacterium]